jgi:hypothetical protein
MRKIKLIGILRLILALTVGYAASAWTDESTLSQTKDLMTNLIQHATGNLPSAQQQVLIDNLRGQSVAGASGASSAGRAVAGMAGVGSCTRHFYNKSDYEWAVAMINSGRCQTAGGKSDPSGVCIIPPHGSAVLGYSNNGSVGAQVLMAGAWKGGHYAGGFSLRTVGCYIEHDGNTGNVVLNDPADGDIATCGRDSYPCKN